ncbi:protein-glutamate O-methyltransferase CheR [Sphingomonas yunnanensis]|uniref:CheR family methyltransferase n=1 Tax=Sphingomonas yunnanensis TaxID=310400 RepID=UPI001CA609CA|nr:protein-glutamate O-methyltransferase CheR [Sphingomonas yunnanensis]MBY9063078.1 protein-glutamate O-methyltransferase CheR [Sphingomonas yunnanensis]
MIPWSPDLPVHYAGLPEPEDRLSRRDFVRLSGYILEQSGIRLPDVKATMLEGRLRRRVRATGHASLADYCATLFERGGLAGEREHLLNAVTTNKTDFFRGPRHFDYLLAEVLPRLRDAGVPRLRAWSAGCSTGAEPYTLAMLLDSFALDHGGPDYGILATDLDTEALAVARRGVFPSVQLDPVPPLLRQRYLRRALDGRRDELRVVPELRAAIGFAPLNLIDQHYPVGAPMHLIFCRNVLIYFERDMQGAVVRRLAECLAPGGLLFLGHSESIAGLDLPLVSVAGTVFARA